MPGMKACVSRWVFLMMGGVCLGLIGAETPTGAGSAPGIVGASADGGPVQLKVPAGEGKAGFSLREASAVGLVPSAKYERPKDRPISAMGNSGLAAGDVNGDGRPDLFVCGMNAPNVLYINQGKVGEWKFADETKARGLELRGWELRGAVFADVDGDRDLDLVVTSLNGGRNWLFANDGQGNFSESLLVPWLRFRGCGSISAALADVDGDGDLDLYTTGFRQEFHDVQLTPLVSRQLMDAGMEALSRGRAAPAVFYEYFTPNFGPNGTLRTPKKNGAPGVLYLNRLSEGLGFRAVTDRDGRFLAENGRPVAMRRAQGHEAAFRDVNGDGQPDLYVCNDFEWQDDFWLNDGRGKGFRMRRVQPLAMRRQSWFTMGVDFGDIDRDGHTDFMTVDMLSRDHKRRKTQMGAMAATDNTGQNIGRIDDRPQIMQNTLFHNRGDNTWTEIAQLAGVKASEWSWGIRFADVDLDGYEDILVATGMNRDFMDADALNTIKEKKMDQSLDAILQSRELYSKLPTPNVVYRNQHGDGRRLRFEDMSVSWGMETDPDKLAKNAPDPHSAVSGGMALADFDGDGDLDVVFNNHDAPLGIYENVATAPRVLVRLVGLGGNTQGIGAKVGLIGGAVGPDGASIEQWTEIHAGSGYASGSDTVAVFSARKPREAGMKLVVRWRNGKVSEIDGVQANHRYTIHEQFSRVSPVPSRPHVAKAFSDASERLWIKVQPNAPANPLRHIEAGYDDFKRQALLPNRLSQLGPAVAWHDVNRDGNLDLVVGSGRTGRTDIWHGDGKGEFKHYLEGRKAAEGNIEAKLDQAGILGWTPRAGESGLLIGVSNHEVMTKLEQEHQQYPARIGQWRQLTQLAQQRQQAAPPRPPQPDALPGPVELATELKPLYAAEPSVREMRFQKEIPEVAQALPGNLATTGPMALADVDNDGDLDLFVGGRAIPGQYPASADSRLFLNNNGTLMPDSEANKVFAKAGLVSGAVFGDLDNDGDIDLVLACEWGPVKIFKNTDGKFANVTTRLGLEKQLGWWNSVALGDLNGDGQLDIIAGNWGRNSKYEQSYRKGEPLQIFYGNFDKDNGQLDIMEAHMDKKMRCLVPERGKSCTSRAMDYLLDRIGTFDQFGGSDLKGVLGEERMEEAKVVDANTLASKVFYNLGPGKGFREQELPIEAQFAPVFGINVLDYDGDGDDDVFLAQNFFASQSETPRSDGGRGLLLANDGKGGLKPLTSMESGLEIHGEQRGSAVADFNGDGCPDIVITQNGYRVSLYENVTNNPGLRVRINAGPANPTGIGCVVRLKTGEAAGPARLVTAGSGYWSQDSPVLIMAAKAPTHAEIHWPGRQKPTLTAIPKDASEIHIGQDGKLIPATKEKD